MADEGGSGLEPIRVRDGDPPRPRAPRPAVFLDRDGVLNQVPGDGSRASSPRNENELRLVPGAAEAVRRLAGAGYLLVVVTNQPDVARGGMPFATAIALTRSVVDRLGLDDGYLCPHDGPDGCPCRKPAGGMLTTASRDWAIDLTASWLIGDRWVDLGAARAAGVQSVLVERAYSWGVAGGAAPPSDLRPTVVVTGLGDAVDAILNAAPR